jgi:hypothetical protein
MDATNNQIELIKALHKEKDEMTLTIIEFREEVAFYKSKLDNMTKNIRMMNNVSDKF